MTDNLQRTHAANNTLNDETFMGALTFTQEAIIKELLKAKTPEERENKWQEYHALERAKNRLAIWASEVRHNNKDST
jgi:hypothetical protein